jgi:hypothetical protein
VGLVPANWASLVSVDMPVNCGIDKGGWREAPMAGKWPRPELATARRRETGGLHGRPWGGGTARLRTGQRRLNSEGEQAHRRGQRGQGTQRAARAAAYGGDAVGRASMVGATWPMRAQHVGQGDGAGMAVRRRGPTAHEPAGKGQPRRAGPAAARPTRSRARGAKTA